MKSKILVMVAVTFLLMVPYFYSYPSFFNASIEKYIDKEVEPGNMDGNVESTNVPPLHSHSGTRSGEITFTNVTDEVCLSGVRGDTYAWGDYNNDGYQDLLVKGSRLFKNNGPPDWDFSEVTEEVGLDGSGYAVWGDYNNDGFLDFFAVGHPYQYWDTLWMNLGPPDYGFMNVTESAGNLDDGMPGLAAGWADYDRDSFLDLYIVNWRDEEDIKYPDVLWHNNGDGTFSDVTVEAGVDEGDEPYAGMGVNWGDYNNDGWPDIYVSNYLVTPNYLYENNGDGTFTNVAFDKNAAGEAPAGEYYGHTAGSSWADYDHDGDLDMWVSNLAHTTDPRGFYTDYSQMLRNDGPDEGYAFTDVRDETGIEKKPYMSEDELHFGIAWGDYDNDGDIDMFIPQIKNYVEYAYSYFFENQGDGTFVDVSDDVGVKVWDSDGACWADYNNDGYIDLITEGKYPYENGKYELRLFRNNGVNTNKWLEVGLVANESNRASIGARVKVTYDGVTQMKEVEGGTAGHSYQHSLVQHFGLGDYEGTADVEVWWPSGEERILNDVPLNQRTIISACDFDSVLFEVSLSNREPFEGDVVTVSAVVQNAGGNNIDSLNVKFFDGEPNTNLIGIGTLSNLAPGEKQSAEVQWDTTDEKGNHTITVLIDNIVPQDDIIVNNIFRINLKVIRYIPDLIVSSITFSDISPEEGDTITITASIQNIGNIMADSATIAFYDKEVLTSPIGIEILNDIQAGEYQESQIQWDTTGKLGNNTITVLIEYVSPEEDNTQNNIGIKEIEVREKTQEPPEPPPEELNHPPEIHDFFAEPSSILMGESCILTVYAEDEDNDPLSYIYHAPDGFIEGQGDIVTWYAPEKEGVFEIIVTVRDTGNLEDSESVSIEVNANVPPEIKRALASPSSAQSNGIDRILFTAEIEDENGLDDIEDVKIDLSSIGGRSRQRMYDDGNEGDEIAEDGIYSYEIVIVEGVEPGEKTIEITVKDKSGHESSKEVIITVISEEEEKDSKDFSLLVPIVILSCIAVVAVMVLAYVLIKRRGKTQYY